MPCIIEITRVATGQTVKHREPDDWDTSGTAYDWSDGNHGCDCNRSTRFEEAGGDLGDDSGECGSERFRCVAVLPDGRRIDVDDGRAE